MEFAALVDIALPVVYVLVGAVLVWFVVELALTIRSTRATIDDAHEELVPTLQHVEKITAQVEPLVGNVNTLIVEQVTPLMEKANALAEEARPWAGSIPSWSACLSRWMRRIWSSCGSIRSWRT